MSKKKTHEEFINEIQKLNPTYSIVGKYTTNRTKIKCKCNICGHEWDAFPYALLSGKGCIMCGYQKSKDKRKKDNKSFIEELKNITNTIVPLDEYNGAFAKIKVQCTQCGNIWDATPHNLLRGHGCSACNINRPIKPIDKFLEDLYSVNNDIEYLDGYIMTTEKVHVKCRMCGYDWWTIGSHLTSGRGCPICNMSHGERHIRNYLCSHNIRHISQKTFDDLIGLGGGQLSYDFYLPQYNLLIEYQGEFHDGMAQYQTIEGLNKQQEHDKRKKEYAQSHNINLLEIWYYDFDNIENILNNHLTQQNDLYCKIP